MSHLRARLLLVAAVVLGAMVVAPVTNAAQTALPAADPLKNIPVSDATGPVTFDGTLDIQRFVVRNGNLVAIGRLTGTATDAATGTTKRVAGQLVRLPVDATGTCQILHLELGPLDLDLLGLIIHLDKVVLDITAQSGPGRLLGNLLCAIAGLLDDSPLPVSGVAALLNQITRVLAGPDVFRNIPITGTGANGAVFDGTLDITRFARTTDGLAAVGRLTGTLTRPDGTTEQIVGRAVRIPLQANGTCRILHLELGPLDLDLLGLIIHLDKVVLDITARTGPGRLLGNLLCALARLLDPPRAGSGWLLNRLLAVTQSVSNLPVAGTGAGGTFAGVVDIQRFSTRNGQLVAIGRLTGLLDTGGAVQRVTDLRAVFPVRATAVCQILHLELGPLDLDLLGLVVHLNRVVLDITAQSGPGRLLGNLLCGLAGLLDRPATVAGILNRNLLLARLGR